MSIDKTKEFKDWSDLDNVSNILSKLLIILVDVKTIDVENLSFNLLKSKINCNRLKETASKNLNI